MVNSRDDPTTDASSSFETHVGSHGALGGPQGRGFVTYPKSFPGLPEVVGAEALHRVSRDWLTGLGLPSRSGNDGGLREGVASLEDKTSGVH